MSFFKDGLRLKDSLRITRLLNATLKHCLEKERAAFKDLGDLEESILDSYIRLYHRIMESDSLEDLRKEATKELQSLNEAIGADEYPAARDEVYADALSPDQET